MSQVCNLMTLLRDLLIQNTTHLGFAPQRLDMTPLADLAGKKAQRDCLRSGLP